MNSAEVLPVLERFKKTCGGPLLNSVCQLNQIRFLIDSGSETSLLPANNADRQQQKYQKATFQLVAANGSAIRTYGSRKLLIIIGHDEQYPWTFYLADVGFAILGADFIRHYGLFIDLVNKRLTRQNSPVSSVIKQIDMPEIHEPSGTFPEEFSRLLSSFPSIISFPSVNAFPEANDVVHHIITQGPSVFSNFRRRDAQKLPEAQR